MNKKHKILILEDEEGLRHITRRTCSYHGYEEVLATGDPDEAVMLFKEKMPEICFLDIHMENSEKDGVDVLREIKAIKPETYCVMATRIIDDEMIEKAMNSGADHYLVKPFIGKDLLEAADKAEKIIKEREGVKQD